MQVKIDDLRNFGTILGIWAHPDDESWTSAGLALSATSAGNHYVAFFATMGESGVQDETRWPKDELAAIRQKELESALKILGITEYHSLLYPDGSLKNLPSEDAVSKITEVIRRIQPQTVVTFGPDGLTGHDDHKTVSEWASMAIKMAALPSPTNLLQAVESLEWYQSVGKQIDAEFNIYFNTDMPYLVPEAEIDVVFELPPEILEQKLAALQAHTSQMERLFDVLSPIQLQKMFGTEKFMRITT